MKRIVDVFGASLLLLVCLPLMLLIGMAVLADGGPVFFVHRRVGRDGREFGCIKFRSMRPGAEQLLVSFLQANTAAAAEWASTHKLRHDPRVTRLGRVLRSSSLDELPQLFNVLSGSMSLVGPRPVTRDELLKHYAPAGGLRAYLAVQPGLTGLWQVSGRSDSPYAERVALDMAYARNLSVKADIVILARTVEAVLRRRGAH